MKQQDSINILKDNKSWHDRKLLSGSFIKRNNIKLNSYGFRGSDIDSTTPGILFLGGAEVIGIGVNSEQMFTSIVSKEFGLSDWNLGTHTCSFDTIYRLAVGWVHKIQSNISAIVVVFDNKNIHSLELISGNRIFNIDKAGSDLFVRQYHGSQEAGELTKRKTKLALQHLCSIYNIPKLVWVDIDNTSIVDSAKDIIFSQNHIGIQSHKNIANKIIQELHNVPE